MRLFAERGYTETPIKAIARACNMSDAGVFHYFPSKRDILEAILDRPRRRMPSYLHNEPVRDARTLDLLVFRTLDSATENEPILRVLIRQQLAGDAEAMAARDMALANWQVSLASWFRLYLPEQIPSLVHAFVNAMMGWIFVMQLKHGAKLVELLYDEETRADAARHVRASMSIERFRLRDEHRAQDDATS